MSMFTSPVSAVSLVRKSLFTHLLGASPDTPHLVGGFPAHSPAFIDAATGTSLSRGSLRSYALQLAHSLHSLPKPLGRPSNATTVLVFSPNSIVWPIIFLGAVAAGFTATLANSAYTPAELEHQYRDSGAHLIFVHPALFNVVQQMLASMGVSDSDIRARVVLATSDWLTGVPDQGNLSGFTCLQDLLGRGELVSEVSFDEQRSDETVCLCYSSGTTGKPKGVETTHYNLTSLVSIAEPVWPRSTPCLAPSLAEARKTKQPDVHFGCLPYFHIYGLAKLVLLPLFLGTPTVVMGGFDPEKFLDAIEKHRATIVLVVPPILVVLARHPAIPKYNLTSLRIIFSGAAPLSSDLVTVVRKRFHSIGSNVVISQAYGLTETSPTVLLLPMQHANDHVGSVGFVLPNLEVRLVREEDGMALTDLEDGGEVWVRGPTVMKGYLNNPAATAASITPDGWFKTGDIAQRDRNGMLAIVDRRKELIKYKGFQVPPAELESVLLQHPEVADTAVIGVESHEEATEYPRAYIVPAQPVPQKDAESFALGVQGWVAARVAPHKRLRGGIVIVEQIPKSASGKILRRDLRGRTKTDVAFGQVTLRAKL